MRYILLAVALLVLISTYIPLQAASIYEMRHPQTQNPESIIIRLDLPAKDIAWNFSSDQLATVGSETLEIWSVIDGKLVENIESDTLSAALSVDWHPKRAEVATLGSRMIVWDITAKTNLGLISYPENETNPGVVTWNPSGDTLAFSHWDNTNNIRTRLLSENTKQFHDIGDPHLSSIISISWSPDGSKLAISDYHSAKVWDVTTGHLAFELPQANYIAELAWSPNGKMLTGANACLESCASQKTFQLWDGNNGHFLSEISISTSDVLSVSWSPDSNMLATGSADKTIRIWSVIKRGVLLTLQGHTASVTKVRWSPDGKKIASISNDSTIRIWDVASRQ